MRNGKMKLFLFFSAVLIILYGINFIVNYRVVDGKLRCGRYLNYRVDDWKNIQYEEIEKELERYMDGDTEDIFISPACSFDNNKDYGISYRKIMQWSNIYNYYGFEIHKAKSALFGKVRLLHQRGKEYDLYTLRIMKDRLFIESVAKGGTINEFQQKKLIELGEAFEFFKSVDLETIEEESGGFKEKDQIFVYFSISPGDAEYTSHLENYHHYNRENIHDESQKRIFLVINTRKKNKKEYVRVYSDIEIGI